MKAQYAKITIQVMLVSLLAFLLVGCGESGSPGGGSGIGKTAAISMASGVQSLPADGKTATTLTLNMTDSSGNSVDERTSVKVHTNLGHFRNGEKEYKLETIDDSGTIQVTFTAGTTPGTAEIWAESNDVEQKVEVMLYDPDKVGGLQLDAGSEAIIADGSRQVGIFAKVTDADGNPIEGLTVNFETTLGKFAQGSSGSEEAISTLLEDSEKRTTATTDVDGEARVMLVSGTKRGTAEITADSEGFMETTTVEFTAGTPDSISLRAAPSTIKPGGDTTLIATLLDKNGNPVEDETVNFYKIPSISGGELNAVTDSTDVNGEAEVTYTAGSEMGEDVIQATSASNAKMADTTVTIDPGAIVVDSIEVISGSSELVADGASQTKIRATITDADGQPAADKAVNFSTTAGTLSAESAKTNGDGIAEVMLQSTTNTGPAIVRAECDGFIEKAEVEFVPGPAEYILLYAFPDMVAPNDSFEVAAIVLDQYDNRSESERLSFLVREAGSSAVLDSKEMPASEADSGVYRFETSAAYGETDLEITAETSNVTSETVTVTVDENAVRVGSITLSANPTELPSDGTSSSAVTATILDTNGNPVPKGTTVKFATTLGRFAACEGPSWCPITMETEDDSGTITVSLIASSEAGTAKVTALAGCASQSTYVVFGGAGGDDDSSIGSVSLSADADSIPVNGGSTAITATLLDTTGEPMPQGTEVTFETTLGTFPGGTPVTLSTEDDSGEVTTSLIAGIDGGVAEITATCDGITQVLNIQIDDGEVSIGQINLTATPETLPADGISSSEIRVEILNSSGDPVPQGTDVVLNTDRGTFNDGSTSISSSIGNDNGVFITSLIAGDSEEIATITATSGDVSQSKLVFFVDEVPQIGSVSLSADKQSIPADGDSSTEITATLKDTTGEPMPQGTEVTFETTSGNFPGGTPVTLSTADDSGAVSTSLIAGTSGDVAEVKASCNGVTQLLNIIIYTTPPYIGAIDLTASEDSIPADGTSSAAITAEITNISEEPVSSGTPVVFNTSAGTFANGESSVSLETTGDSGIVEVSLIAGDTTDTDVDVDATAGGVTQRIVIEFE